MGLRADVTVFVQLAGRASLEAAQRGATHYMLLSGGVGQVSNGNTVIVLRSGPNT
jgi:hypothetical protein